MSWMSTIDPTLPHPCNWRLHANGVRKILLLVSQRLKTVWSHYLWLKQKADNESLLPPSTAPSLPQPGKRFMIVRTEVNGPQLGLMVNGGRTQGRGNVVAAAAAVGFDVLASPYSGSDSMAEYQDGASGSRPKSSTSSDEKKSEGGSMKKKWSLLGKVLNMSSGKSDADEQAEKARRDAASSSSTRSFAGGLTVPSSKTTRLGSPSSDSGSSTGSAPVFDSAQFVFRFMLHNIPWQGQSGGPMGSPGGVVLPPVYRDRILTRPRLPAPAQACVSSCLAFAGRRSGSLPPPPADLAPVTWRISGAMAGGLVSEAKNANPTESVPADGSTSGRTRPRVNSWMSSHSGASSVSPRARSRAGEEDRSAAVSKGDQDDERSASASPHSCNNSLDNDSGREREREQEREQEHERGRAVVQATEPIGPAALLRAKYGGRALAEWSLVVNECNSFVDRRRDEGVSGLKEVEVPCLGIEGLRRLV